MEHYRLALNHDLIDPNFSNYKLSLDSLPTYQLTLERGVDVKQFQYNDQYSFLHDKAFGIHNHLFPDPWNMDSAWFLDEKWHVNRVTMDTVLSGPVSVFEIPDASDRQLIPNRVNVTLHFTNQNWSVVADGTGWLYVLKTGDRLQEGVWKVGYKGQPLGEDIYFKVIHSTWHASDNICYLDVLCLHIEKLSSSFVAKLVWLTFSSDNENNFELSRVRRLKSGDVPDYGVLQGQASNIIVACRKPVHFEYDSVMPVIKDGEDLTSHNDEKPLVYTWTQDADGLRIFFKLLPDVDKGEISCNLMTSHIDVRIKNSELPLLNGDLHKSIKVDESTWTLNDEHILELHLAKALNDETWTSVVEGDNSGEYHLDPEQMAVVTRMLEPFTSDVMNPDPAGRKKAFNVEQLEECDDFPEDSAAIWCLNGETHKITQQVDISSNQWLFSGMASSEHQLPIVCLRHDVDGVVWQPESTESGSLIWKHAGTFNAFGYVQASKQERKFTINAPDFSYVAIIDCIRHVFVYRQPMPITSPLRNRKTGEKVDAIAKQQVLSLESVDEILGVQATNKKIFILDGKTIYAVRVNDA